MPGESYHVTCGMADVTDSKCNRLIIHILIDSYREATALKQVPEER